LLACAGDMNMLRRAEGYAVSKPENIMRSRANQGSYWVLGPSIDGGDFSLPT
jgi:hypothetical protein